MEINLREVSIRELTAGYQNDDEAGVRALDGALDIRPPYQREFIYKPEQQMAVIDTVLKGYPLNVMYWAARDDGSFEVIDGQQRTLSICQFVASKLNVMVSGIEKYFHNLPDDQQNAILDYRLTVYICTGSTSEKLEWFKTINIAGEELTQQELRNAVFAGPFVSDAKKFFSKTGCVAFKRASDYINGTPIRQDYLETAIRWHARHLGVESIECYMGEHQKDVNSNLLRQYFSSVIDWVDINFDKKAYKKIMKGVDWGLLFKNYGTTMRDKAADALRIKKLIIDSNVQRKIGIIPYLLSGDEHHLGLRAFPDDIKLEVYEQQNHRCAVCNKEFDISQMEGDHITPWAEGGKTVRENCQMLCKECNRRKGKK